MLTQACKYVINYTLINASVGLPKLVQNDYLHPKTRKL